jgi:hypothetical protein
MTTLATLATSATFAIGATNAICASGVTALMRKAIAYS